MNYYLLIDAIIYLLLFLSLAKLVFLKVYKENKKESTLISVGIGLVLTVSMVLVEMNSHFYLGMLQPLAIIIFLLLIAILLYNLFLGLFGEDNKSISASITYLIIYGLLTVPFNILSKWIDTNAAWLSAILVIASFIAAINLMIQLFNVLTKGVGSAGSAFKDSGIKDWFKKKPNGDDDTSGGDKPPKDESGTVELIIPLQDGSTHYTDHGTPVNVQFNVSGPGLSKRYDYEVRINNRILGDRVRGVRGNRIHNTPFMPGVYPSISGNNTITVITYPFRRISRASKVIATTGDVPFVVDANPTYLLTYLVSTINPRIGALNNLYRGTPSTGGPNFVDYARILLVRRWLAYTGHYAYAPTVMDVNRYISRRAELQTISSEITTLFNNVTANPDFLRLTPIQRNIIIHALHNFVLLRTGIATFNRDTVNNFRRVPPNPIVPRAGP